MKKAFLALAAVAVLFSSCKKSSSTSAEPAVQSYTIDGVYDIHIADAEADFMPVTLTYHNLAQERVTVSLAGAPAWLPAVVAMQSSSSGNVYIPGPWIGTPTYTLSLRFYGGLHLANYTPGVYPMTLTAVGSVSGSKVVNFNLICD